MTRVVLAGIACLAGATFAPSAAGAQRGSTANVQNVQRDSTLDAQTSALAAKLRCPVCQGESIQDSPAELAQQMRALVREQLEAGRTPDEVQAYFVSKYGEWILLEPARTGLNWVLYALPIVLSIGGVLFVALLVRRWTTAPPDGPIEPPPA